MRYKPEHKDESYRKVLLSASRMMRKKGVDNISIAAVMTDAGLTQGAFYAHFESKEDLAEKAITSALTDSVANLVEQIRAGEARGHSATRSIVDFYLGEAHAESPWRGCALSSVAQEVGRSAPPLRRAMSSKIEEVVGVVAPHMPGATIEEQSARAELLYSALVGVLTLGRVHLSRSERLAYVSRCREQLLRMFGEAL